MASTALSPNSAAHDPPTGLYFGSNTKHEKTCQVCLKGLFPDTCALFPALLLVFWKVLADHCYSSWHLDSADAPSWKSHKRMLLLRPEGPWLRSAVVKGLAGKARTALVSPGGRGQPFTLPRGGPVSAETQGIRGACKLLESTPSEDLEGFLPF